MDYQGLTGKIYHVEEKRINGGGEGTIYGIHGMPCHVAKIFKADKRSAEREEKLRFMVQKGATAIDLQHITWPLDVIYDKNGFAGYIMQKIENVQSLTAVYSGEKYNLQNRLLAAYNLCAAIDTVHHMGQVCGDLNPQNICINLNENDKQNRFKVTLVDADSYHFITPEKTYRCEVGLADYLAPEIQKKVSGNVTLRNAELPTFTRETDLFALAVHVFTLLMNGCHPFACAKRLNGTLQDTMAQMTSSNQRESVVAPQPIENIKDGFFPFYDSREKVTIPIYAPPLSSLPSEIRGLFIRTFKDGYTDPTKRATAEEWCGVLKAEVNRLSPCPKHHLYFKDVSEECPFCKIDKNIQLMLGKGRDIDENREDVVEEESKETGGSGSQATLKREKTPPKSPAEIAKKLIKDLVITFLVLFVFWFLVYFLQEMENSDNVQTPSDSGYTEDVGMQEMDFTKCGMKMQVPAGAEIADGIGFAVVDTEKLQCKELGFETKKRSNLCEELGTTGNFYEEPSEKYVSYVQTEDAGDSTTLQEITPVVLGNYHFVKAVYTDGEETQWHYCEYSALHQGFKYIFELQSDQEISQEDMQLAEQMIASAQFCQVPVKFNLVDEAGSKLDLDTDAYWELLVNLGDDAGDDSGSIYVHDRDSNTDPELLPPGHYTAKLIMEDGDNNEVTSYLSSFDVTGEGEVNVAFSM